MKRSKKEPEGIRKRNGKYNIRVSAKGEDGKRKFLERSGFDTLKEAKLARAELLVKIEKKGIIREHIKVNLEYVYKEFIEKEAKFDREKSTLKRYDSIYRNHLEPLWGDREIRSISADEVTEYLNSKTLDLENTYIRSIHKVGSVIWAYAERKEYIDENIMSKVRLPKRGVVEKKKKVYTKEELRVLEERFKSTNLLTAFLIGRDLGVRVSECFALCWSDINCEKRTIRINKQLAYEDKMWTIKKTKTQASIREIDIPQRLYEYLKELKIRQQEQKKRLGSAYKVNKVAINRGRNKKIEIVEDLDLINVKANGELLTTDSVKFLSKIAKKDLDIDFKFHNLRHTHASVLAEMNVPTVAVKQRLGHSKIETTLAYYNHVTEGMKEHMINAINTY